MRRIIALVFTALGAGGCFALTEENAPDAGCRSDLDCGLNERCEAGACRLPVCEASDQKAWYRDDDGDTFGALDAAPTIACVPPEEEGWTSQPGDCDDADPTQSPASTVEACGLPRLEACSDELGRCELVLDARLRFGVPDESNHNYNFGQGIAAGDLDGDRHVDLALRSFRRSVAPQNDKDDDRRVALFFGPCAPAPDGSGCLDPDVKLDGPAGSVLSERLQVIADLDGDGDDELWLNANEEVAAGGVWALLVRGGPRAGFAALAADLPAGRAASTPGVVAIRAEGPVRFVPAGDLAPADPASTRGFGLISGGRLWLFDALPPETSTLALDATLAASASWSGTIADDGYEALGDARWDVTGDGVPDLVLARGSKLVGIGSEDVTVVPGPFPPGDHATVDLRSVVPGALTLAVPSASPSASSYVGRALLVRRLRGGPAEIWLSDDRWRRSPSDAQACGRVHVLSVKGDALEERATIEGDPDVMWFGYSLEGPPEGAPERDASDVLVVGHYHAEPPATPYEAALFREPVPDGVHRASELRATRISGLNEYGAIAGDLDQDGTLDYVLSNYEWDEAWVLYGGPGRF